MRKQHSAAFKAKVVLETLNDTKTLTQIASEHGLHPTLLSKWRGEALAALPAVFERGTKKEVADAAHEQRIEQLYQALNKHSC